MEEILLLWEDRDLCWHEGTGKLPSVDTAIESINAILRSHYSFRNLLPVLKFLDLLLHGSKDWAGERGGLNASEALCEHSSLNTKLMPWCGSIRMYLCSQTRVSHNVCVPSHANLHLVASPSLKLWTTSATFNETLWPMTRNSLLMELAVLGGKDWGLSLSYFMSRMHNLSYTASR